LKADSKPSIRLSINAIAASGKQGINSTNSSNLLGTYYGLVSGNIPIFNWGARKQKVKEQTY
jgi:outer membrane protein